MTRLRAAGAALAAGALLAGCTYTRQDVEAPPPRPFALRVFPYPTYNRDEGVAGHLAVGFRRPANRLPPATSEAFELDALIAASGTRGLLLSYDRPARTRRWRVYALAGTERLNRAPYYGLGNDAPLDDSLESLYPRFYRYQLLRSTLYAAYQRAIAGWNLRLHVAAQARHYRARPLLEDTTLFARNAAAGGARPDTGRANTAELRLGLLWDTRDEEPTPSRGLLLEAMAAQALGDEDYTRWLLGARAWFPLDADAVWILGLRQTTELARGDVPFFVAYERLTTWYLEDGFGGERSLRLQPRGRYVAPNRTVVSADLRKKVFDFPWPTSPIRVWALAFADAGRLWNAGQTPGLEGLHWSAGVGGRIQIAKATMFGLDLGGSDAGAGFAVGTTFAF